MSFNTIAYNKIDQLVKGIVSDAKSTDKKQDYKSAVAVIIKVENQSNKVLVALSTATDDRKDKYCFPGGGIEEGETVYQAAKREAKEECDIYVTCLPYSILHDSNIPGVGFVLCKYIGGEVNLNDEFTEYQWIDTSNMPNNLLSNNVEIIDLLEMMGIIN